MCISNILDTGDAAKHKETWEAILLCGQAIEEKLNRAASGGKKAVERPKLSTLCSFLNNVYHVRPIPRDLYRASDIPLAIDTCFDNMAMHVDQARNFQAKLMDLLDEASDS